MSCRVPFFVRPSPDLATTEITDFASRTAQNEAWSGSGGLRNYAKFSVTLTSGASDTCGFLNSIQIVNTSTIPEPSTFALLVGLLALRSSAFRRQRRLP